MVKTYISTCIRHSYRSFRFRLERLCRHTQMFLCIDKYKNLHRHTIIYTFSLVPTFSQFSSSTSSFYRFFSFFRTNFSCAHIQNLPFKFQSVDLSVIRSGQILAKFLSFSLEALVQACIHVLIRWFPHFWYKLHICIPPDSYTYIRALLSSHNQLAF